MGAPSGQEDADDPLREARAYNNCIYLFVGMPYLLLGGVSFLIYRKVKAARKAALPVGDLGLRSQDQRID